MTIGSRPEASERRRRAILDAALAVFLSHGIEAAAMEEIRARSGASIGSIYHHFGSKEELAAALYREGLSRYYQGFLHELQRHGDARAGIEAAVSYHLRWIGEHRDWARYLFHFREVEALRSGDTALRDLHRAFYRSVAAWMEPHVRGGAIPHLPGDLYTAIWFGPAREFTRQWLAGRATCTLDRAAVVLAAAAWQAISSEAPARMS